MPERKRRRQGGGRRRKVVIKISPVGYTLHIIAIYILFIIH